MAVFSFLVVCLVTTMAVQAENVLLRSASGSLFPLSYDYYDEKCEDLEGIVWSKMKTIVQLQHNAPAQLLRLMFHDCFIGVLSIISILDENLFIFLVFCWFFLNFWVLFYSDSIFLLFCHLLQIVILDMCIFMSYWLGFRGSLAVNHAYQYASCNWDFCTNLIYFITLWIDYDLCAHLCTLVSFWKFYYLIRSLSL